jgi:hypothetical protein
MRGVCALHELSHAWRRCTAGDSADQKDGPEVAQLAACLEALCQCRTPSGLQESHKGCQHFRASLAAAAEQFIQ